jgi:hypothetical protein
LWVAFFLSGGCRRAREGGGKKGSKERFMVHGFTRIAKIKTVVEAGCEYLN